MTSRPIRLAAVLALFTTPAAAQHWATVWAGAAQGPYPLGVTAGQPNLAAAFPDPGRGAHDQTFRLAVKPDLFARLMRFRFSNAFGARPVRFDGAFAGLQMSGAAVVPGTNRPITFAGKPAVTIAPGAEAWSDPVLLPFVHGPDAADLAGRRLAVTFHVPGDSGPMTWHALAMTTSYVTAPEAGAVGELEDESAYPNSATSWFFLDAVDAAVPPDTRVVVCLGDGLTDGAGSTLNGDDRWTDVLSRRLHAVDGARVAVVNAGIAGNTVLGGADPGPGGPPAMARLERDVLGLSSVSHVVWLQGAADLAAGAAPGAVGDAMAAAAGQIRARIKGVKLIGATLPGARDGAEDRRHALNAALGKPGLFDATLDFDAALRDQQTGAPGLDRAGALAMGEAAELRLFAPPYVRPKPRPAPRTATAPADAPGASPSAAPSSAASQ